MPEKIFPNPLPKSKSAANLVKVEQKGSVSERLMEADCKSAGLRLR
ncbi:hypothetical protein CRC_01181 [Cylindrospermopsis raciborskii CS-505]|nr:hypothetical protein CRC_01181 [Cylindrospermopsis raciborskii CS-505]